MGDVIVALLFIAGIPGFGYFVYEQVCCWRTNRDARIFHKRLGVRPELAYEDTWIAIRARSLEDD